jgi:hypothetical protein
LLPVELLHFILVDAEWLNLVDQVAAAATCRLWRGLLDSYFNGFREKAKEGLETKLEALQEQFSKIHATFWKDSDIDTQALGTDLQQGLSIFEAPFSERKRILGYHDNSLLEQKGYAGLNMGRIIVIRSGNKLWLQPHNMCVGDLVMLHYGCPVSVDGIVVDGSVDVDASRLTGEALPQRLCKG